MSVAATVFGRRSLRWSVPVLAAAVAGVIGTGVLSAKADSELPTVSVEQLLAAVEQTHVAGFSGTVVENAALGLPQLPDLGGTSPSTSLTSLLAGSHTMRVWYAGPTKQRVALLATVGETDIFRDGTSLWQWDSQSHTATHTTLPADSDQNAAPSTPSTLTPQQLAQRALDAIDPTTSVTMGANRSVAGRAAYQLVLAPKDQSSRIGSVRIAVDGKKKVPIGVQVFARDDTAKPALDVSFSSINFATPEDSNFAFTPPKSAIVKQGELVPDKAGSGDRVGQAQAVDRNSRTIGTGWTSVLLVQDAASVTNSQPVQAFLTPVSGAWGSGHLFSSKLLTALITDDGRVFAGAVDPDVLYADAAAYK
ncbi:MAG: hypothetical protein JO147_01115 [Actinobacteria bacterium]|nr:hypothetical protein [Actinomycetota bacterium]